MRMWVVKKQISLTSETIADLPSTDDGTEVIAPA